MKDDVFGEDFKGLEVDSYQFFPAIDGSYLGLRLSHSSKKEVARVAFPIESVDQLLRQIERGLAICKVRREEARH